MTKFIETKEGYINAAKITAIETYGSHGAAIELDGGRRITLDLDAAKRLYRDIEENNATIIPASQADRAVVIICYEQDGEKVAEVVSRKIVAWERSGDYIAPITSQDKWPGEKVLVVNPDGTLTDCDDATYGSVADYLAQHLPEHTHLSRQAEAAA